MTSEEYWKLRQIEREKFFNKLVGKDLSGDIRKYYLSSLSKIKKEIAALYAQFGKENKLSPAAARKLIRGDEFKIWRMELQEYVKAAQIDSSILKELNTLAMRSRITRLEALHAKTLIEIADLSEKLNDKETAIQTRAYLANYYGNTYDIHKEVGYHNAERLVRTELNYIENRAAADSIKDADLEYYKFVATLDHRTTPTCQSLDGQVFPVEEMNQGSNAPPMHCRCRSTIIPSLGESTGKRIAKNADGKRIKIPAAMNYADWQKVYIDKTKTLAEWQSENKSLQSAATTAKIRTDADVLKEYNTVLAKRRLAEKEHEKAVHAEKQARNDLTAWILLTDTEQIKIIQRVTDARAAINAQDDVLNKLRVECAKRKIVLTNELEKAYDAADLAIIKDKVKNAPENIRILWNRFEGDMKILDKNYSGTSHYLSDPNKGLYGIEIDSYKDKIEHPTEYRIPPFNIIFHELGHLIDNHIGNKLYYCSVNFDGGSFGNTLRQEAKDYIKSVLQKLKADALKVGKSPKSVTKSDAYDFVAKEITALSHAQKTDVSDMFEGATKGKVRDGWGHGKSYWKYDFRLPREAFAEMFSAVINNPESLTTIQKYFPKSYKIFEDMIDDSVKTLK